MSLSTARLTVSLAFAVIAFVVFRFVKEFAGIEGAAIGAFLLGINFIAFAYSRVATLDLLSTMFVVIGLALLLRRDQRGFGRDIAAGIVLTLAILTKSIAIYAIPVAVFAAWTPGRPGRENITRCLTVALLPILLVSLYTFGVYRAYEADYRYYFSTITPNADNPVATFVSGVGGVQHVGRGFTLGCILLTLAAARYSRRFRTHRLVILSTAWIGAFLVVLSLRQYTPPRYYLPLVVPFSILGGLAVHHLTAQRGYKMAIALAWTVLAGIAAIEGRKVVELLASPHFSFVRMAREVAKITQSSGSEVRLFGAIADSVALETGIYPVNSIHAPRPLDWKLDHFRPTHWIAFADAAAGPHVEARYRLTEIGAWEIFGGNPYYARDRVRLFLLTPRTATESAVR
jgi:hypothetical protein